MKKPFLPILPFLIKYPFMNFSKMFRFEHEDTITNLENAVNFVKSVLEDKFSLKYEKSKLLCSDCVFRDECVGFESCEYPILNYSLIYTKAKKSVLEWIKIKVVVSNLDDFLRTRFAVKLARAYRDLLNKEDDDFLVLIAWDLGLKVDEDDIFNYLKRFYIQPEFKVDVVDYIKLAVKLKDESWKLVNRKLFKGYVYLNRGDFVRLIEEAMKNRFLEKIPVKVNVDIGVNVKRNYKFESLPIEFECFPECMKRILADLNDGKNVPHTGRFAIASFLINLNCDVDKVVEIFRNAPDFDEDKTRYQVEHIAGMRGKGERYISPSCETMKSWGLCIWNCDVDHPMKYYRRCLSERRGRGKRSSKRKSDTSNDT